MLEKAVEAGLVKTERIDEAVRRVLLLKFRRGLFDEPFVPESAHYQVYASAEKFPEPGRLAAETPVLLKNTGGVLPMDAKGLRILLAGPAADDIYAQLGDYTPPQRPGTGSTVRAALEHLVAAGGGQLVYERGCGMFEPAPAEELARMTGAAARCDAVVAVCPQDNINIMVAQIAERLFQVPRVLARIGDPSRKRMFAERLSMRAVCPTNLTAEALLHGLLEGPDHVGGVERMAVGEPQPGLQREGVAQAILGDLPLLGQTGGQGIVLAAGDERLVHVAEQRLLDGGVVVGTDVDRRRCIRNADGDGRVGLDRADGNDTAALEQRPARPQQHAQRGGDRHEQGPTFPRIVPLSTHGTECSRCV